MTVWLKQSTTVTVQFGPFVDKGDGVTLETGLATAMDNATTGIRLSKNGAAFADRNDSTVPAYDAMGCYRITLNATDTNTLGTLRMIFEEAATCLPGWMDFMVVPANVWDSMFGSDKLEVDLNQMGGVAQSATDLKDFADEGYDPATNKVEGVKTVDTTTTNTDMLTAAAVNGEVLDVMNTDTFSLPGQAAPPASPTLVQAITWLYKFLRNKKDATATLIQLYDDAGSTVDAKRTISDDGTTYTEEEVVSGP